VILRAFGQRFPDVQLLLKEMNPDQVVRGVQKQQLDVGLIYLPLDTIRLKVRTVQREPLLAVLPTTHAQAAQPAITLRSLAHEAFIAPPRYTAVAGLYAHMMAACRQVGFTPHIVQEAWLMQTIIGLVGANMGVALVPASVQNLHRAGVIYKPLQDVSVEVSMGVIWLCEETLPPLQRFLEVVDEVALTQTESVL